MMNEAARSAKFGCATHSLFGQMPLEVRLHHQHGELVAVIRQFVA